MNYFVSLEPTFGWRIKKKSIVLENIYRERILHGGAKLRILFSSGKTISYYYHIERRQRVGKMILLTRCDRS